MIKQAIEYLIGDGLVTCFASSLLLNNRLDRIRRELVSFGIEQNSPWNFINEKCYWQAYDSAEQRGGTRLAMPPNDESDLEVEVGSIRDENSGRRAIVHEANVETDFTESPAYRSPESDTNELSEGTSVIAKNDQDVVEAKTNRPMKNEGEEERRGLAGDIKCGEMGRGSARLRIVIRKRRSTDPRYRPLKVTRLPFPCNPNYLTIQLYRPVSSFSETCLTITRRKFVNRVRNVCGCSNNALRKLSGEIVKELRLCCEIEAGHVNSEARSGLGNGSGSCVFIDRVPISRNALQRASTDVLRSTPRQEELECNKTTTHKASFYSPCSDDNVVEDESATAHEQKEIEFVPSPSPTKTHVSSNEVAQSSADRSEGLQLDKIAGKNVEASRQRDAPNAEYLENSTEFSTRVMETESRQDSRIRFPLKNTADEMEGDSVEKSSRPRGSNEEKRANGENSARSSYADTSLTTELCDFEFESTSSSTDSQIERDSLCSCSNDVRTEGTLKNDVQADAKDARSSDVVKELSFRGPLEGPLFGPRNFLSVSVQTSKTEMASKAVSVDGTREQLIMTLESRSENVSCTSHANSDRANGERTKTEYTFVTDIFNKLDDHRNTVDVLNEERFLSPIALSEENCNIAHSSCRVNASSISGSYAAPSELSFRIRSHELRMTSKTFRSLDSWDANGSVRQKLPRNPMRFTVRLSSNSFGNERTADSVDEVERRSKSQRYEGVRRAFAQFRNRISNRGGVFKDSRSPLCGVSIDRIKCLIRRKFRGVVTRTRERGTDTSKTLLKSASKRFTCCAHARVRDSIDSRETFLSEFRESSARGFDVCNEIRTSRSSRMFGGTDTLTNIRTVEASNFSENYERSDRRKMHIEQERTNDKTLRANVEAKLHASLFSDSNKTTETDQRSAKELIPRRCNTCECQTYHETVRTGKPMPRMKIHRGVDEPFHGHFSNENARYRCDSSSSRISAAEIRSETTEFRGSYIRHARNHGDTFRTKRRIVTSTRAPTEVPFEVNDTGDLAGELRSKLSQYVALCKTAKDSLIKRLSSLACEDRD